MLKIYYITLLWMFAVPAGKGKLEKISIGISSICDCKGAQEDILQDIFDIQCLRPRRCFILENILMNIFSSLSCPSATTASPMMR